MWTPIQLEMRQEAGAKPYLILRLKYRDQNWIFANRVKLIFGDNQMEFNLPERTTSVESGNINEYYSIILNDKEAEQFCSYLYALEKNSAFALRFYGANVCVAIPNGLTMGATKGMLRKNAEEMAEVMKFHDVLSSEEN